MRLGWRSAQMTQRDTPIAAEIFTLGQTRAQIAAEIRTQAQRVTYGGVFECKRRREWGKRPAPMA